MRKRNLLNTLIVISFFHLSLILILINGCALLGSNKLSPNKPSKPDSARKNKSNEEAIQAWIQQLNGEKAIADQARESLIKAGSVVIPALAKILENCDDFGLCWEAVNIMGYIEDPQATPYLVEQSLKATNHHVRWRAIWALFSMPKDKSLPPLLKALEDPDEKLRWNAAVALSNFDRKEAVPILKEGLKSHSSWIQWEAINALGRVYDQETVPALLALLDCSTCTMKDIRQETILSLGKIGDSKATPALVKALADSSPDIRWRAAMALGNIMDVSALPVLEKCLETETDELVKNSIGETVGKLKKAGPMSLSESKEVSFPNNETSIK